MLSVPQYVTDTLNILETHNFEAYIVGGCVRDLIIGRSPSDFDVTTNAEPNEVIKIFSQSGFKVIETGLKHGTVTVLINEYPIEITTYRIDSEYIDNRHPESVTFTKSLYEDTARRDFTMNAIAYNPKRGLADYHNGESDIRNKKIRCVGDPDKRFSEDALRIMRAVRFSSVLGFEIESETESAMFRNKHLIANISAERILSETEKLICGKDVKRVLMNYTEIISVPIPELIKMKNFNQHNPHHIYDVLEHTAITVENISPIPYLRFAALFHDIGKPDTFSLDESQTGHFYGHSKISTETADTILKRLKSDNETREKVTTLIKHHDTPIESNKKAIRRKLSKLGEQQFFDLINLQRADNQAQSPTLIHRQSHFNEIENQAKEILSQQECFSLKHLKINGNDLITIGFRGKEIGKTLTHLLDQVIEEKIPNERESLLKYARGGTEENGRF